jgi:hypothetical protein
MVEKHGKIWSFCHKTRENLVDKVVKSLAEFFSVGAVMRGNAKMVPTMSYHSPNSPPALPLQRGLIWLD